MTSDFATTTSARHSASQPRPRPSAVGSISVPMATKKKIANRSRNGSSRRRASAETGPSLMRQAGDERRERERDAGEQRARAGDRQAGRDRDGEEQVRLAAQPGEDARQQASDDDGERARRRPCRAR